MADDPMRRVRWGNRMKIRGLVEWAVERRCFWCTGQRPITPDGNMLRFELGAHFTVYTMDRAAGVRAEMPSRTGWKPSSRTSPPLSTRSVGMSWSWVTRMALCVRWKRRSAHRRWRRLVLYEPPVGGAVAPGEEWLVKAQEEIDRGEREADLESFFIEVVGVPDR